MHDETVPRFAREEVRAAAAAGRVFFSSLDAQRVILNEGIDPDEIAKALSEMTPACFHKCEVSQADGHVGEVYDWHLCPFTPWTHASKRKTCVLSVKFELVGGVLRIFRLHRSKPSGR